MTQVQADYLYTRFFDVSLSANGKPQPSAVINFGDQLPSQSIIPVVYITQEALNAMSWQNLDYYARNIVKLIRRKAEHIQCSPKEIQIDCDWTRRNKELYFSLLNHIEVQPYLRDKTLSATIRLHQIKYAQKTGIPPVDKGLLMVYNMDDLTNSEVKNSIISLQTSKQYLSYLPNYPLNLDVALPIYSWALLFEEKPMKGVTRSFKGILRGISLNDLENSVLFKPQDGNRFIVQQDTVYHGYRLETDELIRFEQANFSVVHKVANYISKQLTQDRLRVLLYQCDSALFKQFSDHEMEKIFTDFN